MATHRAAALGTLDQVGPRQHVEVLHDRGQRHRERLRELGHGLIVPPSQLLENGPPRRVCQRGKRTIEPFVLNVNHVVKYCDIGRRVKALVREAPTCAVMSARWNGSFAQSGVHPPELAFAGTCPRESASCDDACTSAQTRGAQLERVTLRAKARAGGRATVTRFKSVHPGRWDLDQSAGFQRDGEAQMAAHSVVPVRRLSEPRALFL